MATIILKVDPSELKRAAEDVTRKITNIENACNELGTAIENSASYWEGEASNLHREKYQKIKEDISNVIQTMKHRPQDLLTMAGLYEEAETVNESTAEGLQGSLIS